MYILDTDILTWILRGKNDVVEAVSRLKNTGILSASVISVAEIYKNIFPSEVTTTEDFLLRHDIIDVDQKIAKIGGLYWQQYVKSIRTLSLTDCLIAATAHAHNLTLVSLNTRHFPMRDINVMSPAFGV